MVKFTFPALFCALFLLLASACSNDKAAFSPLARGARVLAFGDSVTYGVGANEGEDYPARLAAQTGWYVVNAGVSGERADQARERIHDELDRFKPVLVLIELGGNDFLQRRSVSQVKEDLRFIIAQVRSSGALPVLVAVPALEPLQAVMGSLRDAPLYAELAKEEGVPLIPHVFSDILSDKSLTSDTVHPNAAGYQKMSEGYAKALAAIGLLRR